MRLFHKHKFLLERRNEMNKDRNKIKYQYKHTYNCKKCGKKKIEYTRDRMEY